MPSYGSHKNDHNEMWEYVRCNMNWCRLLYTVADLLTYCWQDDAVFYATFPMEQPLKTQRTVLSIQRSEDSSAIMESIDSPSLLGQSRLMQSPYSEGNKSVGSLPPDVTLTTEFTQLKLGSRSDEGSGGSFLLLDGKENLKVFYYLLVWSVSCVLYKN